ncbi:DUF4359 domain-containing protein [Guptibacillus hwajinpoensis]|uniref:DUF4359 domain-containing protein n=1 Tax=Guptibacillus hwajinpoensis TaxID=208199 RepID=A0ABU0K3S3_9BACL|nr:DUF4359 domain-containing protein [Alkalihalobacillus hemicentroti]MDQ0483310.1 hypothetical protein [Alkalihalobacillus hemicentroti]
MRNKFLIIIGLLSIVLFITNPNQEDYSNWVGDQMKKNQNALIEIGVDLAVVPYVKENTTRDNWYLFSIYKTEIWDGNEVVAIGVFNQFILDQKKVSGKVDE